MTPFAHLSVHSDFSFGKGASKIGALVERAKAIGMPAMALTDDCNMHGALKFSKEAAKVGLQPIMGTKLWISMPGGRTPLHGALNVIAQSDVGFRNICRILERAWLPQPGPEGTEAPNRNEEYAVTPFAAVVEEGGLDGIIVLTGGNDGLIRRLVAASRGNEAAECLRALASRTPGDRTYVEFGRSAPPDRERSVLEDALFGLAKQCRVPVVATSDVYYATPDRADAYEILRAIITKSTVMMGDGAAADRGSFHMRDAEEMTALFRDMPEALSNTLEVAKRCAFKAQGRAPILPPFPCMGGRSENEELVRLAHEGLNARLDQQQVPAEEHAKYRARLDFEIATIVKMNFAGYFLIVADFIVWALNQDIPVGPGRGSGAGSLVAYALRITDLDPLKFDLLFERFLNPDRVSMPDFDIDFCEDRRGEVMQYVRKRYGSERVSQITTFTEIKSKSALSDVGRVLQHARLGSFGFGQLKRLSGMIPRDPKSSTADPYKLQKAYEQVPEFKEAIDAEEKYGFLFENSKQVEGLYRNTSSHAAGVIIAGKPIRDLVPVGYDDKKGVSLSQFDMKDAESAGLVKFDFLGLTTLSVIREASAHVRNFYKKTDFDLTSLPLDDPKIFDLYTEGRTVGVFQFESEGMRRNLAEMKPNRIEDLIAANALYRPGPMENFPLYNSRKNGLAEPEYPEPRHLTESVLAETFGIMVYQEQVMKIAQVVAGYTLAQADVLRRAMGKKQREEMDAQKEKFAEGAAAKGVAVDAARRLFDLVAKFADYGFNKSHSAAYSVISYRTAYLKVRYPAAFYAAQLSYEKDDEKMANYKKDMEAHGVLLLLPDINKSYARFAPETAEDGSAAVRYGLKAIKQISGAVGEIERVRAEGGPFLSLQDFSERAGSIFTKPQRENLVAAGCFDSIEPIRGRCAALLEWMAKKPKAVVGQNSLFGDAPQTMTPPAATLETKEWDNRAARELAAVGFYLSMHPLDRWLNRLKIHGVKRRASIEEFMKTKKKTQVGSNVRLAGAVDDFQKKTSRNGDSYFSVRIAEKTDVYNLMIFGWGEQPMGEVQTVLQTASDNGLPIVIYARYTLDHTRNDFAVRVERISGVQEAVGHLRCNLELDISADQWVPSGDDLRKIEALRKTVSESDLATAKREIADEAAARDADSLLTMLEGQRRDASDTAVKVTLFVKLHREVKTKELAGRYEIEEGFDMRLRALPTFAGMREFA